MSIIFRVFLVFASATLYNLSQPGYELFFLAFFFTVPLHIASKGLSPGRSFILYYVSGFISWTWLLSWIPAAILKGGLPLSVAILGLVIISAFAALFFGLFGFVRGYLKVPHFIIDPILWVSIEYLWGLIIPWGFVGYSLWKIKPLIQIAELTGVYGLSYLIIFVSSLFCDIWDAKKEDISSNWIKAGAILCLFLFVFSFIFGEWRIRTSSSTSKKGLNILLIHSEYEQIIKWKEKDIILNGYLELTNKALKDLADKNQKPDLIIWPETALTLFFPADKRLTDRLKEFVFNNDIQLLTGAPAYEMINGKRIFFNRAYLINKKGFEYYDKNILVPFGEYIPFRHILEKSKFLRTRFRALEQVNGDFISGDSIQLFKVNDLNFDVLICWEAIYPSFVRKAVKKGADFLVNMSNDAWLEKTRGVDQHLAYSLLRAVENKTYLIRSSNQGVSAVISPTGKIISLKKSKEGYVLVPIGGEETLTVYSRFGDFFAILMLVFLGAFLLVNRRKNY